MATDTPAKSDGWDALKAWLQEIPEDTEEEIMHEQIMVAISALKEKKAAEALKMGKVEVEQIQEVDPDLEKLLAEEEATEKAQAAWAQVKEEEAKAGGLSELLTPAQLKELVFGPEGTKIKTPKGTIILLGGDQPVVLDGMVENVKLNPFLPTGAEPPKEQVAPEPVLNPPTCKFFAIARSLAEANHAVEPEDWPYEGFLGHHGCMSPKMNARGQIACEMVNEQHMCVFYEESDGTILQPVRLTKKTRMGMPGEIREVALDQNRFDYGTPGIDLGIMDADAAGSFENSEWISKKRFFRHDYETEEEWMAVAQNAYDEELADFGDHEVSEATEIENNEETVVASYLKELVTVSESSAAE